MAEDYDPKSGTPDQDLSELNTVSNPRGEGSDSDESNALEDAPETAPIGSNIVSNPSPTIQPSPPNHPSKETFTQRILRVVKHFDIYLLIFVLIVLLAAIGIVYGLAKNKTPIPKNTNATEPLTQSLLNQLNNNDTMIGNSGQIITIQPNAVFGGSALVKGNLQVAGTFQTGGSLDVSGITVTGTTKLGNVSSNDLSVSGSINASGNETIQQGLSVNGPATFSAPVSTGQLSVTNLILNGDLSIPHHIITSGSIPMDTPESALGSGGTSSVNGTDTSGAVTINTGSNASNGCLVTITFSKAYNSIPNVVLTQIETSSTVPMFNYYVSRTSAGFSICSQNTPQAANFGFDYFVIN